MLGRRRRQPPDPRLPYQQWREATLALDAATTGWRPTPRLPDVLGVVVEVGLPWGSSTLVARADGSAEQATSTGRHALAASADVLDVAAAVRGLLAVVQARLADLPTAEDDDPPAAGHVRVHALTVGGRRTVDRREEPLAAGVDELSPLWFAAEEVRRQLATCSRT